MDWITTEGSLTSDQKHKRNCMAPPIRLQEVQPVKDARSGRSVSAEHSPGDQHPHLEKSPLQSLFDTKGFRRRFQPNSTILLHGDPADVVYLVESGTVRCCTIDDQGTRQIFAFASEGAFVGISDFDNWHFTAEAVDHVVVKYVPRVILEQEFAVNIPLRQEIRTYIASLLAQREEQLLTLVNASGPERLYRFLTGFAASRSAQGYVDLPMCRRDIGDHIGLSMESVSRAFSHLKRAGQIDLKSPEKYRIVA